MSVSSLSHLLKLVVKGIEPTAAERQDIVKETILLVLSRATDSDANIKHIEIDTVRDMVKKTTGEDVSAKDVRMAAHSKLYESAPLEKQLRRVSGRIDAHDRVAIAQALAGVILVDERITNKEVRFFNMVVGALALTPAHLAGLFPTH